jgi:hypothetical protein
MEFSGSIAKLAQGDIDEMILKQIEAGIRLCGMTQDNAGIYALKTVKRQLCWDFKNCQKIVKNADPSDKAEYPVLVKELRMARARHTAFAKKTLASQ